MVRGVIAPPDPQIPLLWVPPVINCWNTASARNAYGNAAEEIACHLLSITPIPIDGRYTTCFDGVRDGAYFEIKSSKHKGGKVVVYDWRLNKEQSAGVSLTYLLVCHSLSGERSDILRAMASRSILIYSVPADVLHTFAFACSLNIVKRQAKNPRDGYARAGYRDGYRNLPISQMHTACRWHDKQITNTLGTGKVTLRTFVSRKP